MDKRRKTLDKIKLKPAPTTAAAAKKWMNINANVVVLFIDLFIGGALCRFLNTLFIVIVVACHWLFFLLHHTFIIGSRGLVSSVAMCSVLLHVLTLSTHTTHNVVRTLIHSLIWHWFSLIFFCSIRTVRMEWKELCVRMCERMHARTHVCMASSATGQLCTWQNHEVCNL